MKRIGVIANFDKPHAADMLRLLGKSAHELGVALVAGGKTASLLKICRRVRTSGVTRGIDALIALGGDGTVIRAARMLQGRDIPVIGVNIGGLGFLTTVARNDLAKAMKCLAENNFTTSERSVIDCRIRRGRRIIARDRALNDVVIHNAESSRIVTLEVAVDRRKLSPYRCDGLVVSTPTGSTGHSLSAGGPILAPETPAFVVTAICPHTLGSRPLVVSDSSIVGIVVPLESAGVPSLSVDGQTHRKLKRGDQVEVRRSSKCVHFIHLPDYSYFALLRHKLHWRGSASHTGSGVD